MLRRAHMKPAPVWYSAILGMLGNGMPYLEDAKCDGCGEPVEAWYTGRHDYHDGEEIYMCDCPNCGRYRARKQT